MLTPLILFLGLTVATAVIAHWSDNLGKKLGKKRVSLFGLRPRTTATILTVASSWAIMLFTLVVLLAAFVPLRNALFSYDSERAQATRDRAKASAEIERSRARLKETQGQYNEANAKLTQANSDAAQSQKAAAAAKATANQAIESGKKAVAAAQNRTIAAQSRVAAAQQKFQQAQARERVALKNEATAKRDTRNAEADTRKAAAATLQAQRLREQAAAELKNARAELKRVTKQRQDVQANLKDLQANYKEVEASYKKANFVAFEKGRKVLEAESRLDAIQQQVAVLAQQRNAFLGNDAPVKVNQVFAARVIAANQPSGVVAAQLQNLLAQGQQNFSDAEDITPLFPPDTKLELLPLKDQIGARTIDLEGDQLIQRLARDIAQSRQTVSIRLIAPRNYLASETHIEAIFVAVPIAPAFKPGEVLATTIIDGAQGDARIFRSLLDLTDLGRREAEKRRVNPPQSPDEPNFYAEGTNVNLFETLRRLESSGARLRVNLVAAKALSTVEPLQVRFEIEDGNLGAPDVAAPQISPTASPTASPSPTP